MCIHMKISDVVNELLESIAAMVRIPKTETEMKQNQKIRIAVA